MEWRKGEYLVSDNKELIDEEKVFQMISGSYWAYGRTKEKIIKTIENSLCFGVYYNNELVGFARVVTDKVVFSYIMDVIIDYNYRGKGLGKWLVECILSHQDVKDTKQRLATKDAHGLYEKFNFKMEECMGRLPHHID